MISNFLFQPFCRSSSPRSIINIWPWNFLFILSLLWLRKGEAVKFLSTFYHLAQKFCWSVLFGLQLNKSLSPSVYLSINECFVLSIKSMYGLWSMDYIGANINFQISLILILKSFFGKLVMHIACMINGSSGFV